MKIQVLDCPRILALSLLLVLAGSELTAQRRGAEPLDEKQVDKAARAEPAKFFVVRHADRDGKKDALTEAGRNRALALRDFMLEQDVRAVYSTDTTRTRDTVGPTARAAKLEIQIYASRLPAKSWFTTLATKHAGQSVLVVGHSNTVVPFVRALGGRTSYRYSEDDYHPMFIVSVRDGDAQAVRINYGQMAAKRGEPVLKREEQPKKMRAPEGTSREKRAALRRRPTPAGAGQ